MGEQNDDISGVVSRIASLLGAGLGASIGAQIGDPVSGAMVGEAFAQVGDDFARRVLSPRQERRVASVLDLAGRMVAEGIAGGRSIRDDGFFDGDEPEATEVFEGVLLAARDEHEAKKLPYLANLLAEIGFDDRITVPAANLLLRDAESAAWLQMCLLAIVLRPEEFPLPEVEVSTTGASWGDWAVADTFTQMITPEGSFLFHPTAQTTPEEPIPVWDLRINYLRLTDRARLLTAMLGVKNIPSNELASIHETLSRAAIYGAEHQASR